MPSMDARVTPDTLGGRIPVMRLLLIGAPGSGKGTQAVRLAEHFGITHISSGDLLRQHVVDGTAFGKQVQEYVSRGDLVPDQMVLDMLRKPIVEASAQGGYVLDGFPRTVEQAEIAYETARELGVAVQVAAYLDVGRDELIRRLLARGRGSDDTQEVIEHRLEVYEAKTRPMIEYYANRERLVTVNGARPPDEVSWSLVVQLQKHKRALKKEEDD
jgi:adenylate kinase